MRYIIVAEIHFVGGFMKMFLFLGALFLTSAYASTVDVCDRRLVGEAIRSATQSSYCWQVDKEKLKNLKVLVVNGTADIRLKKRDFEGLEGLKDLQIYNNTIIHQIDEDTFEDLDNLRSLKISSYQGPSFPREALGVSSLKNLENLYFHGSKIESISRSDLSNFSNLKMLGLSAKIDRIDQDAFDDLKKLEQLRLNNRNAIQKVTRRLFKNQGNLRLLKLRGTSSSVLEPDSFRDLENLELLSLSNFYINEFNSQYLSKLKSLRSLDIIGTRIDYFSDDAFSGLSNLRTLGLGQVSMIDGSSLPSSLSDLKHLYISVMENVTLKNGFLDELASLEALELRTSLYGRELVIQDNAFVNLQNLKELTLRGGIYSVPSSVFNLSKLEKASVGMSRMNATGKLAFFVRAGFLGLGKDTTHIFRYLYNLNGKF